MGDDSSSVPFRLFEPWNRIPELQQFSPKMRHEIWERATAASRFGCAAIVFLIAWISYLTELYKITDGEYWRYTRFERAISEWNGILVFATMVIAPFVLVTMQRYVGRKRVRAWLVNTQMYLRAPACLACGYSLIGTPEDSTQCPECGKAIPAGETPATMPKY